jgi:hypothetical protein
MRVQQGLLVRLGHRVRAGHQRLPGHCLVFHRLMGARSGILVPPAVRRSRFRVHAPPSVRNIDLELDLHDLSNIIAEVNLIYNQILLIGDYIRIKMPD